jgi:hypothetical protein
MSDKFLLNASFNWLIWSTDKPSDLEHANLNIDSEVTWATPDAPGGPVTLYDIHKVNCTWPVISTLAGQWDSGTGLVYTLAQFKYLRRGDLQGLLFNAAVAVRWCSSISALRALKATRKSSSTAATCTEIITNRSMRRIQKGLQRRVELSC